MVLFLKKSVGINKISVADFVSNGGSVEVLLPGLFDGSGVPCSNALTKTLCHVGISLKVYSTSGASNSNCYTPANPHLSRTLTPNIVYSGKAIALKSKATRSQEKYGNTPNETRDAAIFGNSSISFRYVGIARQ